MQNILDSLKKQREQILADSGDELLSRHTSLLEIAIISLYNRLANRFSLDTEQFRSSGAILALGAFGRRQVGPDQPVHILILKAESSPWKDNWLEEITSPLLEAGWQIEAQHGTIDDLLCRAQEDLAFLVHLLEARYISGNRQLTDQLDKSVEGFLEHKHDHLLEQLYDSVRAREVRLLEEEGWLEPDIERNPGGLADINAIRSACRLAANIRSLEDAIFQGYLTRQEVDFLQHAEKTYARLLSLLPRLSSDSTGVLQFEEQAQFADQLGYSARSGFLPVEVFMQQIYQLFHGVAWIAQEFWERLHESRSSTNGHGQGGEYVLEDGLVVRSGKLHLQTDRYPATAGHLVRLFAHASRRGLSFANVTRQWIQHHRNVLDTASGDPLVREELLELIRSDGPDLKVVRRFYDQGLLTSLIPELGSVHGLVQHDAFHLYPLHEHHLRTLTQLKRLAAGELSEQEPELTRMAQGVSDPILLYLAALLHDIGKSSGKSHALSGGEMIPAIARRLGLSAEASDTVQFLVAQHLLLVDSASLRDLADEEMLAHCTLMIGNLEQLDLLMLLSYADLWSTGPRAQQKWRDTPVMQLYDMIRHLLERGEPSRQAIAERMEHIRTRVGREVSDVMESAELENYFAQLAPRYLLSMSPSAIVRHLRLVHQLQHSNEPFIWEVASQSENLVEITLISWEMAGLLSQAAGILTLYDLNIHGAQFFTMNNGVVLLIFQCRLPGKDASTLDWDEVRTDMRLLFQGKMALDYRIAAHKARRGDSPQIPIRSAPSQVLIDNDSSEMYTILEVYTLDRVGLLYTISRTLFELQIRIYVAKITTKIDQVADVFYIRTRQGEKVTDPDQIKEVRNALCFWLDGPVRGD